MIIGPKFKIARRLGSRIFPKTQTAKFSLAGSNQIRKPGGRRPRALSEYGQQLIEKQKARYTYLLKERQFGAYVKGVRSRHQKGESPVALLYQALESRLDNVVFRLGLAPSRAAARQLVSHGHIVINDRRLNIPSHLLGLGDRVALRPESRNSGVARFAAEPDADSPGNGKAPKVRGTPSWLGYDEVSGEGKVLARPLLGETESDINFGAILEFYRRV